MEILQFVISAIIGVLWGISVGALRRRRSRYPDWQVTIITGVFVFIMLNAYNFLGFSVWHLLEALVAGMVACYCYRFLGRRTPT